jgi:hypothetical protein
MKTKHVSHYLTINRGLTNNPISMHNIIEQARNKERFVLSLRTLQVRMQEMTRFCGYCRVCPITCQCIAGVGIRCTCETRLNLMFRLAQYTVRLA